MMSDDFERTPGGAVLMDGARLRDETVARIRDELEAMGMEEGNRTAMAQIDAVLADGA